ncbi:MAG: 3-oxoacyl-ACP reductase [Colwellia sp.]
MSIKNKLFNLLGFPDPITLERVTRDELPSVFVLPLADKTNEVILTSLTNLNLNLNLNLLENTQSIEDKSIKSMVVDATQYQNEDSFYGLYTSLQHVIKKLSQNARVVFISNTTCNKQTHQESAFIEGLKGFVKSLAKELGRKGITVNLLQIPSDVSKTLESPLGFFLSPESAFISGQALTIKALATNKIADEEVTIETQKQPNEPKLALVTGASQGIGAAIANNLAHKGFKVVGVDINSAQEKLAQLMQDINGEALCLDVSDKSAGKILIDYLQGSNSDKPVKGFDVIVHNAGITRDKTFAKMPEQWWQSTLDINLLSVMNINDYLIAHQGLAPNARIVCMSSMNGIAGQVGQTNYATSKAGLIGYVKAISTDLVEHGITINAVAPGFIETKMTEQMPFITRELGRKMNALAQGGQPVDVAEAVAFFADSENGGVTGQTLRVCGLNFIGA